MKTMAMLAVAMAVSLAISGAAAPAPNPSRSGWLPADPPPTVAPVVEPMPRK